MVDTINTTPKDVAEQIEQSETTTANLNMNLYELNKLSYMNIPFIEENKLKTITKEKIKNFFEKDDCFYYMMLCKERSDYTLFNTRSKHTVDISSTMADDVLDCMYNRGFGFIDVFVNDDDVLEIWVRERTEGAIPAVYFIFDYDQGVLEY
jgi:hypothetical protein